MGDNSSITQWPLPSNDGETAGRCRAGNVLKYTHSFSSILNLDFEHFILISFVSFTEFPKSVSVIIFFNPFASLFFSENTELSSGRKRHIYYNYYPKCHDGRSHSENNYSRGCFGGESGPWHSHQAAALPGPKQPSKLCAISCLGHFCIIFFKNTYQGTIFLNWLVVIFPLTCALHQTFQDQTFSMLVIRKNLRASERFPYPVRVEAILELIDQFPQRKLEKMTRKGSNSRYYYYCFSKVVL